jgi:hypothetical protein
MRKTRWVNYNKWSRTPQISRTPQAEQKRTKGRSVGVQRSFNRDINAYD